MITDKKLLNNNLDILIKNGLSPQYTFENFDVNANNKLAYSMLYVAAKTLLKGANIMLIYGETGSGKTHLLQAIMNDIILNKSDLSVKYVNAKDFIEECNAIIGRDNTENIKFLADYRSYDVLLIDDAHLIKGYDFVEREMQYIYDAIFNLQKTLILTTNIHPAKLTLSNTGLQARLNNNTTNIIEIKK